MPTKKIKEASFQYMLLGLIALLTMQPILQELYEEPPGLWLQFAFDAVLVIGVWSLFETRRVFVTGIVLAALSITSTIASAVWPGPTLEYVTMAILFVFCGISLVFAMRAVVQDQDIDLNRLMGAICVYLLLGVMWGIAYAFVALVLPGSFQGLGETETFEDTTKLLYYSFVTLTTLGYGDVTPTRPLAQTLAYIQAITGIFYIAILVGTLVGAFLSQQQQKSGRR